MKQMATKCEEDMKLLSDSVKQLTDYLKPLQKGLHDEDVKCQKEKLRAAEEERKLKEKMNAEKQEKNKV